MNILVTGASGQLGHDLSNELKKRGHRVTGASSKDFDLSDPAAIRSFLSVIHPDAVMHCAGYTAVDRAEDDPERCDLINHTGTEVIAHSCSELGCKLMYISTDYVFPGNGKRPWEISDPPRPLNVYGMTKYLGEEAVRRFVSKHFIVRVSWLFGVNGNNFVKTMLRLGKEREQLTVVDDQIGSPTYTKDLSVLLADMIVTEKYGTYHATNEGFCSWYEFACAIMMASGLSCKVLPVSSKQYASRAKRPANSRMSKEALEENGFACLPSWQDALLRYLSELQEI